MDNGIYHNISSKDYHSWTEIVSNSYLGRLAKVPACAKIPQEETEAMKFGRLFHTYVLEPENLDKEYVLVDSFPAKPNRRSTQQTIATYERFIYALNGKQPYSQSDFDIVSRMKESVMNHPSASKFLAEGISETTLIWTDEETGLKCKARPDRIPDGKKGVILNLKSTLNASKNTFQSDCVKYGYARAAGMELEGFSILTGSVYMDLVYAEIAVEKEAPFRCECYTIEADFLEWGYAEFHRLLQIEKICRDNNFYPNYNCAGVESLFKPAYLKVWEFEPMDETMKDFSRGDKS
jgi:hypothetical protein